MSKMTRLVATIAIALSAIQIISAEPVCHMVEVGKCMDIISNYINSLPKRQIPKTAEDINNMCNELTKAFDCWNDFKSRCMTPIQSELEALVMEGVRDLKDRFCSAGSDVSAKYLTHAECLNQVVESDASTGNINQILVLFEKFDAIPDTRKITYACCGWNKMFTAVKQSALDLCGADATSSAEDLLGMAISTLPNVLCQGFDIENERCKKILPPEGAQPTGRHNPFVDGLRYFFKNHLD